MKNNKIYAIIPARGNSKGLPNKNVIELSGKPLIAYTILAAQKCQMIDKFFVSTEDEKIKEVSLNWGANVIDRPHSLAEDWSLTKDVVLHALNVLKNNNDIPDYIVLLQPTSPLRNHIHISECIHKYLGSDGNSIVSVTEAEQHPFKMLIIENDSLRPLYNKDYLQKPRQQLPVIFKPNGAIYCVKSEQFIREKSFFIEKVIPYYMDFKNSIDIDNEMDLLIAKEMISNISTG